MLHAYPVSNINKNIIESSKANFVAHALSVPILRKKIVLVLASSLKKAYCLVMPTEPNLAYPLKSIIKLFYLAS